MGLQFRRGTDSDRLGITPDVGEPLFTTDGKQLYIGDGATAGGILVSGSISDSNDVIGVIGETVDSAYIQARQADIFRDSAFVTDIIDAAYIQARDRIRDSGFVEDIVDSAFVQARQITYDFLDSAEAINLIDSAYVQARQTPQDFAYSSLTGTPTNVSSFANDANYLDSSTVVGVITAAYIQANQTTYDTSDFTDSAYVASEISTAINNLIDGAPGTLDTLNEIAAALNDDDSAYATLVGLINDQLDSSEVIALIDAAYVQARQITYDTSDFTDSAFVTGLPVSTFTNDANYLDSTTVQGVIDATYIQANQTTYSNVSEFNNDANYLDSTTATVLIDSAYINARTDANIDSVALIALVDSAYVQARQAPGTDSAAVTSLITTTVDSAYVNARVSTVDSGQVLNIVELDGYTKLDSTDVINLLPDGTYRGLRTYTFTADSGDTAFTGTDDFGNTLTYSRQSLVVYVNGILLTDSVDYTALDGSTITLTNPADSADVITFHNIVAGGTDSALINQEILSLIDSAYVQARQVDLQRDSGFVTGIIDAAYIQANQITYNTSDFADSAFVTAQINALIDGAPTTLDTLNEIAAALNDDDSAYATLVSLIGTKTDFDSADATALITSYGYSTYDSTNAAAQIEAYGYLTSAIDSVGVIALITANDQQRDSAFVTGIIDSAYIAARVAAGTDSATVISIVENTIDSAYVNARVSTVDSGQVLQIVELDGYTKVDSADVLALVPDGTYRGIRKYSFTADSGQSLFTGADDNSNTLTYSYQSIVVYVNGILLNDSVDYTATNGSSVSLITAADSGDIVTIHNIVAGGTDSALINNQILSYVDSAYIQARQSNADQSLNTTDSVTFASLIVTGDLQVNGTTTTVNTEDLSVTDHMIYLNAGESAGSPTASIDVGWSANVNDDGSYAHVGMFRDATDNAFKVYEGYTPEPDAGAELNTGHASFSLAPFEARTLTGQYLGFDSDFNTKTISDLVNDANYLDSTTVTDVIDATYIQANQTTYDFLDSAEAIALIDSAYVQARQTPQDFAYSSLTGAPTTVSSFTNDAGYLTDALDSAEAIALIATQGYLTDALDSVEAIALITGSDLNMGTNKILYSNVYDSIGALPSASSYHGMFAHVHATGAAYYAHAGSWIQLANNSDLSTYGNSDVISLVDSAYVQARQTAGTDSAATIALITATVDSAYVALREANAGGSGGTDSATVVTLVQSTVDSDYVLARIPDATLQGVNQFEFLADSGQTVFTGADRDGNSLTYNTTDVLVFLNGTLMVPGNDFNTTNSNTITFTEGVDSGDFVNIFNFTAGRAVGGGVSEVNHFDFTADSGQTAFTGSDDNGSILSFIGNDNIQVFINGILLKQSDYTISNNNTVTLTDGADSADEVRIIAYDTYSQRVAIDTYNFTADSGQTVFTGLADDGNSLVFSPGNLQVHLNGIMLRSGNDFSTSGTGTVTLVSGADSGDTLTVTAISGDSAGYATIVPAIIDSAYINARVTILDSADAVNIITAEGFTKYDSNDTIGLVDSAYIQARQTAQDFAYSSLTGAPTAVSSFTNDANYLDSTTVTGVIDASYIQANQTTYSTADFADSAYVTAQIDALIDGAPGTLNTLNEIAAALNDDDSAYATLVGLINAKTDFDSADATTLITSYGYSTYDSTNAAGQIEAYGYSTFDSNDVRTTRWSDNERLIMGDGSDLEIYHNGGNSFVRDLGTGNLVLDTNGISIVLTHSGNAETMAEFVKNGPVDLYYNNVKKAETTLNGFNVSGVLTVDSVALDSAWVAARTSAGTDSSTVVSLITETVDSAYVAARSSAGTDSATVQSIVQGLVDSAYVQARQSDTGGSSTSVNVTMYEYLPDSGATIISGNDRDGIALSYQTGNIQVFRNGILLVDSNDYQATDGSTITLTTSAEAGDYISVASWTEGTAINLSDYEFLADSGQTAFSGIATNGETLTYTPGNIIVHLNGILLSDSADYTATNGSAITLTTAADSADILSVIAFTGSSSVNDYVEATTNITAIANKKYIVDTSSGAVTVILPASPVFGDEVKIIDGTGNAGTNNITINRNSNKILGADSDFTLDVNRAAVDLVYYNVAQGWIVSGNS